MDTGADPGGLVLFLLLLCIDIVTYGFSAAVRSWHPEEPEEESREGKDRDKKRAPRTRDERSASLQSMRRAPGASWST